MTRENTLALRKLPQFSTFTTAAKTEGDYPRIGKTWAKLAFPSVRACHDVAKQYARTANEIAWINSGSHWLGLNDQAASDFDQSGIAQHSLKLVQDAQSSMPKQHTRLAQPHAAITGGFWDTPSVLAGLPLSARTRKRAKLPPREIKIAFFLSSGIQAADMAKLTARICRAIWDYTLEGGAVSLTVAYCGVVRNSPYAGVAIEVKVNTSDVAALALGLSPAMYRTICGPLQTALSDHRKDSIPPPQECPLPGYLWCGGSLQDALRNAEKAIDSLQISGD